MNGSLCTVLHVRNQEIPIGCCCPREIARFSPWLWSSLHRLARAGPDRRIILVLDRAGWQSSQMLRVPDGIHLVFLPPYSPELQRGFRLWPLTIEAIANRSFKRLAELRRGCKHHAVSPESLIRSVSVISLSSIGGLPCPHTRDVSGSNHSFHELLCLSHLLISETVL